MEVAIGLPNAVPGTTGEQLTGWARAAEEAGFSSLGTLDRVVYPNYEPVVALAAAAAVTERIRLASTVILGPLRRNAALVAKQALSIDALGGGGRFMLGIAVGGREDDFEISGVQMSERGVSLDAALVEIRRIWNGEGANEAKVGPPPQGAGPSLVIGGTVDASFERAARHADGWIMGGGSPDEFRSGSEKLNAAWKEHDREGEPRKMSLAYFSLGEDAERNAEHDLGEYYAWLGEEVSGMIVSAAAKDPETVKGYISAFEAAGCDELFFFPCSGDTEQVSLLADAAGL
jgi:alkanesulfonate monooxygenase SsuD/methylene tetrahydromethanopterin reductase-like flavin-dependent oxidoreductase (luciferase family)